MQVLKQQQRRRKKRCEKKPSFNWFSLYGLHFYSTLGKSCKACNWKSSGILNADFSLSFFFFLYFVFRFVSLYICFVTVCVCCIDSNQFTDSSSLIWLLLVLLLLLWNFSFNEWSLICLLVRILIVFSNVKSVRHVKISMHKKLLHNARTIKRVKKELNSRFFFLYYILNNIQTFHLQWILFLLPPPRWVNSKNLVSHQTSKKNWTKIKRGWFFSTLNIIALSCIVDMIALPLSLSHRHL